MSDALDICWKITHGHHGVETVYLVSAPSSRIAKRELTNYLWAEGHVCHDHGCTFSGQEFRPEPPYLLYSIDTKTGEMAMGPLNDKTTCMLCIVQEGKST